MLNKIFLQGRLVADPELRHTQNGVAVASFRLAVDRDFKDRETGERKADFINVVAWRQTGECVSRFLTKGRMAIVSGRLQIRNWTDKDGNKRSSAEVVADNVYFGDSKRDDHAGSAYGGYSAPAQNYGGSNGGYSAPAPAGSYGSYGAPASAPTSDFAMLEEDDAQLPF